MKGPLVRRAACSVALLSSLAACGDEKPNADPPRLYDIESAPEVIRQAARAVVRLQHPAGGAGTGSFISDDGLLLTNDHVLGTEQCAREGCQVTVSFAHQRGSWSVGPRELYAVPVHADVGLDVAVLQLYEDATQKKKLTTSNFLRIETVQASELVGERVIVIGHPLGRLKKWSEGVVVSADGAWFESTVFTLSGSSGSPIVNEAGKIVGLLHRGAEGLDLLTRTSTQVSSLATEGAALELAREELLPSSMISLDAELTREQVVTHSSAFLAGSRLIARVDGVDRSIVSLLGAACDDALARDDATSIEELTNDLGACFAALDFIECRRDVPEAPFDTECPEDDRDEWIERLKSAATKMRGYNGALNLYPISTAIEGLSSEQSEGERMARDNIEALLDDTQPSLDFSLVSYLAAYGIETYDGQNTLDLVLNYRAVPYYERFAWDISLAALWLYGAELLDGKRTIGILRELYRNDKVSLGAKLRIEEVLYNADEL